MKARYLKITYKSIKNIYQVRCGHCAQHKSRQLAEVGVRMCGTWREATVFGCSRAKSNAHTYFPNDWMFSDADATAKSHSNAGALRCISVYGSGLSKRSTVL